MLIFSSHSVGAKERHHSPVVTILLIQAFIQKPTMLRDPGTLDNAVGLRIGRGVRGGDVSPPTLFLHQPLHHLGHLATGAVTLEAA